ncbi:protein SYM1 isoform X2 [Selaginella moellendorffii]|uniref:protein SYM1 isoform X2 n=1 Tax=Selaginella moellendorffii TaxID=88036 RepID=UPI000D1CAA9E|nr:protein SYM1 isoform X2 [Selaginella moellendorffii]|eukprot:XP_024520294.1 protein SYM1 isoform X2 [Selaginella moellendorffii]
MGAIKMRSAWSWYQGQLAAKPVRTQIVTSGILWAVGDMVAQSVSASVEKRQHKSVISPPPLPHGLPSAFTIIAIDPQVEPGPGKDKDGLNWKRVGISSMFGVGFVGPVGHFWFVWSSAMAVLAFPSFSLCRYEGLEHLVHNKLRLRPKSLRFLATKLAADALIFGPIHLVAFFTYSGLAAGKRWEVVRQELGRDFIPAFLTEGAVWPVVQVVNFRFVPVQHQLLYVNFFCLLDSAFLSWFKHQNNAPWKRKLTAFVTGASDDPSSSRDD